MSPSPPAITGCILAGGQGSRLGGVDKGLLTLVDRPLVAHVIARFAPQVDSLWISANRNHEQYRRLCPHVIGDPLAEVGGPLAGIAAALVVATTPLLAIAPCDSPFLPLDLVATLHEALERARADIAVVRTATGMQPVFALIATRLAPSLNDYLASGERKTTAWYARHALIVVDFELEHEAFLNINTPADLATAEQRLDSP